MDIVLDKLCHQCGKEFQTKNSQYHRNTRQKHRFYCSVDCQTASKFRYSTYACDQCGNDVKKRPCDLRQSKSGRVFCNTSCAAKYNNANKVTGTRRSKLELFLEAQVRQEFPSLNVITNDVSTIGAELDMLFPDLKLAVELNGIFHYEPIYGETKFNRITNNDLQKSALCRENGIELCVIDTSHQKKFTEKSSRPYLTVIIDLINKVQGRRRYRKGATGIEPAHTGFAIRAVSHSGTRPI